MAAMMHVAQVSDCLQLPIENCAKCGNPYYWHMMFDVSRVNPGRRICFDCYTKFNNKNRAVQQALRDKAVHS